MREKRSREFPKVSDEAVKKVVSSMNAFSETVKAITFPETRGIMGRFAVAMAAVAKRLEERKRESKCKGSGVSVSGGGK
jgi:hypothetical protein|tara:strand:- start:158 stop:394 length:237 start_codon:yes stop_codon:yes gene_type:complete